MRTLTALSIVLLLAADPCPAAQDAQTSAPGVEPPASQALPQTPKVESPKEAEKSVNDPSAPKHDTQQEADAPLRTIRTDEEHCCYETQDHSKEGTEFWPPFHGFRVKITDSLLAAFTALLFLATILLWWSTRRLVTGAEKTAERQLRAYVGPESDTKAYFVGDAVNYCLVVKNFGQTPARDVHLYLSTDIREFPLTSILNIDVKETVKSTLVLFPGSSVRASIFRDKKYHDAEISNIEAGSSAIYLYGRIEYVDIFDEKRITKFRYYLTKTGYRKCLLEISKDGNEMN